jgi:hypothetical protein
MLLCVVSKTNAQPVCTARILNVKDGRSDACFVRTPNPIGNITKYTILLSGIEIYEVEFTYQKEGDSILIRFYDKQNTLVKLQTVKLKPEDSHYLICDFVPNDRKISNDRNYKILFGIDNPTQQFINLYQFQAIGGVQSQFILEEVPASVISEHIQAVQDYEKIVDIRNAHAANITKLKNEMVLYKDSVLFNIRQKEEAIRLKEATLIADQKLQTRFKSEMDSLFFNYYKNIHWFRNEQYDVNFVFSCNGNGKITIDTMRTINFRTGGQYNWVRDSFLSRIRPQIESRNYETLLDEYRHPNLKAEFSNWFDRRFAGYTNLGEKDMDSFTAIRNTINNEFDTYASRTVSIPTVYSYNFKYVAVLKQPTWKYVKEVSGDEKFNDKSDSKEKVEITDQLKQLFRDKLSAYGNGKYSFKVSFVSLNDAFLSKDMKLIEKK